MRNENWDRDERDRESGGRESSWNRGWNESNAGRYETPGAGGSRFPETDREWAGERGGRPSREWGGSYGESQWGGGGGQSYGGRENESSRQGFSQGGSYGGGYSFGGDYGRRNYENRSNYGAPTSGGYGTGMNRGYEQSRGQGGSFGWERDMTGPHWGGVSSAAGTMDRDYGTQQRGRFSGKGPKGYQRSDERIREDVCDRITEQGEVDAGDVEVQVSSGEVTLTGTVKSRRDKREIEDVCEACTGVKDVHNKLKVKSEDETETSRTNRDAETATPTSAGPSSMGIPKTSRSKT